MSIRLLFEIAIERFQEHARGEISVGGGLVPVLNLKSSPISSKNGDSQQPPN